MRLPSLVCLCVVFLACAAQAQAAIVVTVGSSLVTSAGSIDYLPVYINTDGTAVDLSITSFEFEITTTGSAALQFATPPNSDPSFNDSLYVFYQASGDQDSLQPLGTNLGPSATYFGGDQSDNADFFVPLDATQKLLAMLPVTTLANTAPPVGDTFSVGLVNSPSTFFTDSSATAISISPNSFSPAQVTVTPEPSTFTLLALGLVGLTAGGRRRRRAKSRATIV